MESGPQRGGPELGPEMRVSLGLLSPTACVCCSGPGSVVAAAWAMPGLFSASDPSRLRSPEAPKGLLPG